MTAEDYRMESSGKIAGMLPAWVANVWIAGVVVWFFVIRVLGSGTARHLLSVLGLHQGE